MSKDIIEDLLRADQVSTRSDKIFIAVGLGLTIICGSILAGYVLAALISARAAGWYWLLSLVPMLALLGFSTTLAIKQLLRNLSVSAIITILANLLILGALALVVIFTSFYRGELFLPFFYTL